ncbi:MAG: hypothetical protein FJY81_00910, partial [Candidatus Aminicenantes bacterium]|nr:hypothetical protein [Candidatus Aminicenantes bacterium]
AKNIERAFFQNDARAFHSLLTLRQHLNISLPEPLSFSDHVSTEQAYFLFRKIFSVYSTFEFYADSETSSTASGDSHILKSRWSFKDNRNNNQYVFLVFFYLADETTGPSGGWKIAEIKAQKLL